MSNWLCHDPYWVLIHIPKTGGSTLRKGIWGKAVTGPVYGEIPYDWQKYWKVAFIRHPLARWASAYRDFTQLRGLPYTVEEFVDITLDESVGYGPERSTRSEEVRHHTIPMTHPFNNLDCADTVYRFSEYDQSVRQILNRTKARYKYIPHMRKTNADEASWRDLLLPEHIAPLVDYYREDFKLGYKLP